MRIFSISQVLAGQGVAHLVVAANPETEELYWLKRLAKAVLGKIKSGRLPKPQPFPVGNKPDVPCTVFRIWECLGRDQKQAMHHLGVGDNFDPGNRKSGNRDLYPMLFDLLETRIVLCESGDISVTDDTYGERVAKAYFTSRYNACVFPWDGKQPPTETQLLHELEHARDYARSRFVDTVRPEPGTQEAEDLRKSGRTYYLQLNETKAYCKQLADQINNSLDESRARIEDSRDLVMEPGNRDRSKWIAAYKKLSADFARVLQTSDAFQAWALQRQDTPFNQRGFPSLVLFDNLARWVMTIRPVLALAEQNEKLSEAEKLAVDYVLRFLSALRLDLRNKYAPIIKGLHGPLHFRS